MSKIYEAIQELKELSESLNTATPDNETGLNLVVIKMELDNIIKKLEE